MAGVQFLRQLFLTRFSNPPQNRAIYREFYRSRPASLLEFGVTSLSLTAELADLMRLWHPSADVRVGLLDPFDARFGDAERLTVREINATFANRSVRVALHPGDPSQTLPRIANRLGVTDVLLISEDDEAFAGCWYFVPRLLHSASIVLRKRSGDAEEAFEVVSPTEVTRRAEVAASRLRRAA